MSDEERTKQGGAAFANEYHHGMTLRDWFAGMALCGLAGNSNPDFGKPDAQHDTKMAYEMADAMLAIREQKAK